MVSSLGHEHCSLPRASVDVWMLRMLPPLGHDPDLLSLSRVRGVASASRAKANTSSFEVSFQVMRGFIYSTGS